MTLEDLVLRLGDMSRPEIENVAHRLEVGFVSVADELMWWQVMIAVQRNLTATHRGRFAATAALSASSAVLGAAARGGLSLPDSGVTRVARAAKELARSVVADRFEEYARVVVGQAFGPVLSRNNRGPVDVRGVAA